MQPKDYEPPNVTQVNETTWEEDSGRVWKYAQGNDSLLPIDEPSPNFESVEELTKYFEKSVVPRSGFRILSKENGTYELELDDNSRLELIQYVIDKGCVNLCV